MCYLQLVGKVAISLIPCGKISPFNLYSGFISCVCCHELCNDTLQGDALDDEDNDKDANSDDDDNDDGNNADDVQLLNSDADNDTDEDEQNEREDELLFNGVNDNGDDDDDDDDDEEDDIRSDNNIAKRIDSRIRW